MVWQSQPPTNQKLMKPLTDQRNDSDKEITTIPNGVTTYGSVNLEDSLVNLQGDNYHNKMEKPGVVTHCASEPISHCSGEFCSETGDVIHDNCHGDSFDDDLDLDDCCYCCTWNEYFFSWRFVELMVCVLPFLAIGIYFEFTSLIPRMRPMPFEKVYAADGTSASSGDAWGYPSYTTTAVWNHVNNEKALGETISHREYQVLMGLCPWLVQLALVWFLAPTIQNIDGLVNNFQRWDTLHRTTCMYFVGIGLTDVITNCIKYYVGYLRPVFLDVCQPYYDETNSTYHCAHGEDWDTIDARMSFPSNHSGWSFCGMMLLSMYLERCFGMSSIESQQMKSSDKAELLRARGTQARYRLTTLVCFSPMLFAFFVAASRVVDNRHFPADIVGGAVLGGSVASLVFGIWFPK